MSFWVYSLTYSFGLFAGLLICLKAGYELGMKNSLKEKEDNTGNSLDGVVFALLGLLLAFIFSGSMNSYNAHRDLLTKEANDIYKAYAMLDLLSPETQMELRPMFLEYAESRLEVTQSVPDSAEESAAREHSRLALDRVWLSVCAAVTASTNAAAANGVLGSVSEMATAPAVQLAAHRRRSPEIVYALIFALAMLAALIAGYGMPRSGLTPIRTLVFVVSVVVTMYTIIDLDTPRSGLFTADPNNTTLIEVIGEMRRGIDR